MENSKRIEEVYRLGKKCIASGFHGSLYVGENRKTKEKRAIRVIPNFIVSNSKDFFDEIETLKSMVAVFNYYRIIQT
jgi:hypothetical protein